MLELRTIFPYGLNDRIGDEYKKEDSHFAVGRRFTALKRKHPRISRGKNRSGASKLTCERFLTKLDELLKSNIKEVLNFIRKSLASMKKSQLKTLGKKVSEFLVDVDENSSYAQWYSAISDTIDSKLFKEPVT